jgi:hypothetical protein
MLKGSVNVTISNSLFNTRFSANILKVSGFKNINFVKDDSISKEKSNRSILLSFDSLGEPSCALLWLSTVSNSNRPVTYGTSAAYCLLSFSNTPFVSSYNITRNTVNFNMLMSLTGLVNINLIIKNDLESLKLTTTVTVSNMNCKRPIVDIQNRASNILNPKLIKRSNGFSVVGITTIDCEIKLKSTKQWLVFEVNPKTGLKNRTVNISDIISSFSAEINIPSNFLDYGIYRFTYQVSMDDDANAFTNSVDTFIRIIPSGMAIFTFSGGIKEITIGMGQLIDLDPGKYSYDFDDLLIGTQLTYKFFCRMIIDGEPKEFPSDYYQHNIDLQEMKEKNVSIQLNSCFNNSGNLIFYPNLFHYLLNFKMPFHFQMKIQSCQ